MLRSTSILSSEKTIFAGHNKAYNGYAMTSIEISRVTRADIGLPEDIGRQNFYETFAGGNTLEVSA